MSVLLAEGSIFLRLTARQTSVMAFPADWSTALAPGIVAPGIAATGAAPGLLPDEFARRLLFKPIISAAMVAAAFPPGAEAGGLATVPSAAPAAAVAPA